MYIFLTSTTDIIHPPDPPPPGPPAPHTTTTDWTMSLTDYMNMCVTRLCNESPLLKSGGRHESHSSTRHQSSSGGAHQNQGPSEEDEVELNKWQYITHLASYLYHVGVRMCTYTCIRTILVGYVSRIWIGFLVGFSVILEVFVRF
jgi:hypothetical protein